MLEIVKIKFIAKLALTEPILSFLTSISPFYGKQTALHFPK